MASLDTHHNSYGPRPLSRSDSMTSVESDGYDGPAAVAPNPSRDPISRRTRKRFNSVQLMMLENLFHHNSHPSKQERETLAKAGEMEIKSVTIWFQNKRQTERRGAEKALNNSTNRNAVRNNHTFHSNPFVQSTLSSNSSSISSTKLSARPSLDRVASLSELPEPAQPQFTNEPCTPTRPRIVRTLSADTMVMDQDGNNDHDSTSSHPDDSAITVPIWESMPSSPPVPITSPPAREFVEFGKRTKTRSLEWACARQRMAGKDKEAGRADDEEEDELELRMNEYERKERRRERRESSSSSSKRSKHHHREHRERRSSHSSSRSKSKSSSSPILSSSSSRPRLHRSTSEGDDAKKALERVYLGGRRSMSRAPSSSPGSTLGSGYDHAQSVRQETMGAQNMSMTSTAGTGAQIPMAEDDDVMRAALALCGLGRR